MNLLLTFTPVEYVGPSAYHIAVSFIVHEHPQQSSMKIQAGNGYAIELTHVPEQGMTWVVKLQKKVFGFHRVLSSDWFLNEQQAHTFAGQMVEDIRNGSIQTALTRKPGWTFHRAPR